MRSHTDLLRPHRGLAACLWFGVLMALVHATGLAMDLGATQGEASVATAAVVDASGGTATADAYRRVDVSRRPHQLPATTQVAMVLIAVGAGRRRNAPFRVAPAPLLVVRRSPRDSRAPPYAVA